MDLDADRTARFVSRTAIQRFNGVTDRIEGLIYINTQSLSEDTGGADTELYFEVDLASLDTGLSLHDRHMRNNYLEVEEHPFAAFGGRIVRVDPRPEGGFRVTGQGVFGVHGVERDRSIDCDVTPASDGYRVSCGFEVLLSDHDIEIPKIMFLELQQPGSSRARLPCQTDGGWWVNRIFGRWIPIIVVIPLSAFPFGVAGQDPPARFQRQEG